MHCSGQNFIDLAKQEMPEKLVHCGTGGSFTLTAYRTPRTRYRVFTALPASASRV
jgi:hypothetical protein